MVKPKSKKSDLPAEEKEASQQKAAENFKNAMRRICDALIKRVDVMKASDWKQGWVGDTHRHSSVIPQNVRGRNYSGINVLLLAESTVANGYKVPVFLSFGEAMNLGAHVKRGESSTPVFEYYVKYKNEETGDVIYPKDYNLLSDEEKEKYKETYGYRVESVFNIDQTTLPEVRPDYYRKILDRFKKPQETVETQDAKGMYVNEALDRMFDRDEWVCPIRRDSERGAYYSPMFDYVAVPPKEKFAVSSTPEEKFKDGMEYYSTVLHEMAHSTGHKSRLNRPNSVKWGDATYAREEVIAETTAAALGSMMGFDVRIRDNNAAYIKGWLRKLSGKPDDVKKVLRSVNSASLMIMDKVDKERLALGLEPFLNSNKSGEIKAGTKEYNSIADVVKSEREKRYESRCRYSRPDTEGEGTVAAEDFDLGRYEISEEDLRKEEMLPAEKQSGGQKPTIKDILQNNVTVRPGILASHIEGLKGEGYEENSFPGLIKHNRGMGMPRNLSGRPFEPLNALFLQMDTADKGYKAPVYADKLDIDRLGVKVKEGEKDNAVKIYFYESLYHRNDAKSLPLHKYNRLSPEEKAAYDRQVISESQYRQLPPEARSLYESRPALRTSTVWNIDQTNLREVAPEKYSDLTIGYDIFRIMAHRHTPSDSEGRFADVALDELIRDLRDGKVESETLKAHGKEIVAALGEKPAYDASSPVSAYRQGYAYYGKLLRLLAEQSAQSLPDSKYYVYGQTGDADRRRQVLFASEMTAAMVGSAIGIEKPLSPEAGKESSRIAADLRGENAKERPGGNYLYLNAKELMDAQAKKIIPVIDEYRRRHYLQPLMERDSLMDVTAGDSRTEERKMAYRLEDDSEENVLSEPDVQKEKKDQSPEDGRDISAVREDSNADTDVASLAKILMEENGLSADDASRRAKNILNSKINDNMEEKKKEDAAVKEQQSQKEAEQKSQQVSEQKQQEAKTLEKRQESEKQARQKAEQKAKEEKTPEAKAEKRIPRLVQAALLTAALAEGAKREDGVFMNPDYHHEPQIYGKDFKLKPYNSAMLTLDTDRNGYKSAVYMSSFEARKNEMPVRRGQQSVPLNVVKYDTYVNRFDKEKTITAEEFRKLSKDDKMLYRVKPENSYSPYFNIDQTIMHHVKRDDYDKAVAGNVTKEGYREIALLNASKAAKEYVNTVAGRMGIGITRDASAHETVYDPKTKSIKIGELGEKTGIEEARARLRALVTAVGEPQYLGRKEKMGLPAADAKKYDKLVTEVSTGVLLSKLGVPAALDEKSRSLVPYWERESKENPNFMRAVEYNVNHSVNALQRLSEGKRVDYSVLRGERKDVVSEKASYVASQVSKGADMGTKTFVIIRDDKNKAASVVLPKGASVDVDNEVPGMRKDRIAKALVKEGYEDVKFYNRNGALGLRMTNDEFKDKKVSTANVKQYSIVNERPVNLDKFLRRADTQNIIAVKPFKNQAGKWEINVFPDRGKPFSVRPDQPDMTRFFKAKNGDPVRLEIGQKYAIITRIHPELKTKGPIPDVDKRIDLGRIGKVKIEPDKYNKSKSILWTRIDGKPMHVSVEKADVQSMYATSAHGKGEHTAEDLGRMEEFKTHLAANLFSGYLLGESVAKEQSVAAGESLDAAKVSDSLSVDAAPKVKIEPERESHASRGMH